MGSLARNQHAKQTEHILPSLRLGTRYTDSVVSVVVVIRTKLEDHYSIIKSIGDQNVTAVHDGRHIHSHVACDSRSQPGGLHLRCRA